METFSLTFVKNGILIFSIFIHLCNNITTQYFSQSNRYDQIYEDHFWHTMHFVRNGYLQKNNMPFNNAYGDDYKISIEKGTYSVCSGQ